MAAIPHTFTERNTEDTNSTTTFTAVTSIAQASGNFTVGKKYLIIASAKYGFSATGSTYADVRVVHGSTAFEGSTVQSLVATTTGKEPYLFMTVWTAVSSEGIDIQFRRNPSSTATASINFVSLLTMQLDDYLVDGTDYAFAERTNDDTLSGAYTAGASITWTPATASHDWLVIGWGNFNYASSTATVTTRLNQDAGATVLPQLVQQPTNNGNIMNYAMAKVINLPASSVTFKEEAISSGASTVRLYSAIFALDLDKFAAHAFAYTEADANYASTSGYGDAIQTTSVTPTTTSDTWIFGAYGFDKNNAARVASARIQLDNSDQPAGQTTAAYTLLNTNGTAADEQTWTLSTMASSLSAASHTIDLDGHVDSTTGTPSYQQRTIMAVTMELAANDGVNKLYGKFGGKLVGKL